MTVAFDTVNKADAARVGRLRRSLASLSDRDQAFAGSLIEQWDRTGRLSDKQWPYVDALCERAVSRGGLGGSCAFEVGNIVEVDGEVVKICQGKNGNLYGKVLTPNGWRYKSGAIHRARGGVVMTPNALALFASVHGRETGWCMFCSKQLTDSRSVAFGYGPTCAHKYKLPWGMK